MVDRIVPATKPEDIDRLAALTGVLDLSPVMHEPFRQWVVEDDFVDGARPDLAAAGVQLVEDVTPFELMKLRCLNGTHSVARLHRLPRRPRDHRRHRRRPRLRRLRPPPLGERDHPHPRAPRRARTSAAYADALFARYANPAIRHRTWQIAMDGSQKLPQRILGTIADNRAAGRPCPGLTLAVAAWMHYVGGVDERGRPIDVQGPAGAAASSALSDAAPTSADKVAALLGVAEVFPAAARRRRRLPRRPHRRLRDAGGRGRPRRRLPLRRMTRAAAVLC